MREIYIVKANVGPNRIDNAGTRHRPVQSREIWIQELRGAQVELANIQLQSVKFCQAGIENIDFPLRRPARNRAGHVPVGE